MPKRYTLEIKSQSCIFTSCSLQRLSKSAQISIVDVLLSIAWFSCSRYLVTNMLRLQSISEAAALKIKIEAWFKVLKADFLMGGFLCCPLGPHLEEQMPETQKHIVRVAVLTTAGNISRAKYSSSVDWDRWFVRPWQWLLSNSFKLHSTRLTKSMKAFSALI